MTNSEILEGADYSTIGSGIEREREGIEWRKRFRAEVYIGEMIQVAISLASAICYL